MVVCQHRDAVSGGGAGSVMEGTGKDCCNKGVVEVGHPSSFPYDAVGGGEDGGDSVVSAAPEGWEDPGCEDDGEHNCSHRHHDD